MADVEIRKVQRLGASSLVVTLPHSWARRVGLKPGDSVMIVVEGGSLRVIPVSKSNPSNSINIDLRSVKDPRALNLALPCLYVLGYDEVNVRLGFRDAELISTLRSIASRLPGLEFVDLGGDSVTARVLLDPSRVDLRISIRNMTILISDMVKVISRILRDGFSEELEVEVRSLSEELYKIRSIIERQLHLYPSRYEGGDVNPVLSLTALTLLSLMASFLLDMIDVVKSNLKVNVELSNIVLRIGDLIPVLGSTIVNPSVRRSMEMLWTLNSIRDELVRLLNSGGLEGSQYVVATRILDSAKILQVICYAITCFGLTVGVES